jgi:hypothetical protein
MMRSTPVHSRALALLGASGLCALLAGCSSLQARSPDDYRQATRTMLESKQSDFKSCYEDVIKKTPDAQGSVVVQFTVEEKTGKIVNAASLPSSTAPGPLRACVVKGLSAMQLDPPDQHPGVATMTFDFGRG